MEKTQGDDAAAPEQADERSPERQQREGWLILTRRPGETLYIGTDVTVTVVGVKGNVVRFGINAPRSTVVDRAEIHERKKKGIPPRKNAATPSQPRTEANGNTWSYEPRAPGDAGGDRWTYGPRKGRRNGNC